MQGTLLRAVAAHGMGWVVFPTQAPAARRPHRLFGTSSPQGPGPAAGGASSLLVTTTRVSCPQRCSRARDVLLAALLPSLCQTWGTALPKHTPGMQNHAAGEDMSPAFGRGWSLHRGCLLLVEQRLTPQHRATHSWP